MNKVANKIIVIAGPTASGKTEMAIELAKEIGGEIINADSRSIYKKMDIGTGKPSAKDREKVPHHLFDLLSPNEAFSVASFKKLATEKIADIKSRNNIPIIVGGTGLYIDALIYDYSLTDQEVNLDLRKSLEDKKIEDLFKELKQKDPETAEIIDKNNKRRIVRSLEIYYQTWDSKAKLDNKNSNPKDVFYFAIDLPRDELYKKINKRVEMMFLDGLVKEAADLTNEFPKAEALNTMGYKESLNYLNEDFSLTETIAKTQQEHRNYAKRQLTWFRKNKDIIWINNLTDLRKKLGLT